MKIELGKGMSLNVDNAFKIPDNLVKELNAECGCPIRIHSNCDELTIKCESWTLINNIRKFLMYTMADNIKREMIFEGWK